MGRSRALRFVVVVVLLLTICTTLCSGAPVVDDCAADRCSPDGPEIRFPFRKRGRPPRCGYSTGFELFCRGDETVVELPFSGQFPVTSISYEQQRLHLRAGSCPAATFFNLNLSSSPFDLHEAMRSVQQGYMLLNCSSELPAAPPYTTPDRGSAMGCLDGFGRRFFAVETYALRYLSEACVSMRTEPVPRAFVDRLCGSDGAHYDPSVGWGSPDCSACEAARSSCYMNTSSRQIACSATQIPPISGGRTKSMIIGVSVGASILILASATITKLYLSWKWKRDKEMENQRKIEKFLEDYKSVNPTRYSYAEIKKITDQFKTKLGEGGYGSVFKGVLPTGVEVAVKVLRKILGDSGEEFVNEVRTIGRIHHVNIVRLLGFCADGNKRALVYEFMHNESLEKFIFPADHSAAGAPPVMLGWAKLHEIAVGVARGIEYLHQGCDQRILHFDIKPHNILLDHNFGPKISDFGLAKLCSKDQSVVSMTAARGTVGYIAPEVASRNVGSVSYKSDVYSFGMLLLEMVGGRRNIDASADHPSQIYFPEWVYNRMHRGLELGLHLTGEDLEEAGDAADIARILAVTALWCIQWYPVNRPSMKSVVQMLEGSVESLTMPPNPFVTAVGRVAPDSNLKLPNMNLTTISESETDENI